MVRKGGGGKKHKEGGWVRYGNIKVIATTTLPVVDKLAGLPVNRPVAVPRIGFSVT